MDDPIARYIAARHDYLAAEAPLMHAATPLGLSPSQAVILVLLARDGPQPVSYVARAVHIAPVSGTEAADRLERAGLVCRQRTPTDRRIVRLALTAKGTEVAATFVTALGEASGPIRRSGTMLHTGPS